MPPDGLLPGERLADAGHAVNGAPPASIRDNSADATMYEGYPLAELEAIAQVAQSDVEGALARRRGERDMDTILAAARREYPRTFGGHEVARTGPFALTLFFTAALEESLESVLSSVDLKHLQESEVLVRSVSTSENDLLATYEAISERLRADPAFAGAYASHGVSTEDNVVRLVMRGYDDSEAKDLQAMLQLPGLLIEAEGPSNKIEPTACHSRDDCDWIRAGVGLLSAYAACTTGFTTLDTGGSGRYILTNAHCSGNRLNVNWHQGISSYRYFIGQNNRSVDRIFGRQADGTYVGYDATRVQDSSTAVSTRPYAYHRDNAKDYAIRGLGGTVNAGTYLCFSGAASGDAECGPAGYGPVSYTYVAGNGNTYSVPNNYYFSEKCSNPGDSGGPVYASNIAYGITTARNSGVFKTCSFSASGYYLPVIYVLEPLNLSLVLAP